MAAHPFRFIDLNLTEYSKALQIQEEIVSGKMNKDIHEDIVLVLEHPPVFTLGKNGGAENIRVTDQFLRSKQVSVIQTHRGGSITFHGPGQLVVYPIIDFNRRYIGVTDFVSQLEEIMIRTCQDVGVRASRNPKNRGIWVNNKKLGSIGLCVQKGISFHGLALNVNVDLEPFSWINPCGMKQVTMTSLERELRKKSSTTKINIEAIKKRMTHHFKAMLKPRSKK